MLCCSPRFTTSRSYIETCGRRKRGIGRKTPNSECSTRLQHPTSSRGGGDTGGEGREMDDREVFVKAEADHTNRHQLGLRIDIHKTEIPNGKTTREEICTASRLRVGANMMTFFIFSQKCTSTLFRKANPKCTQHPGCFVNRTVSTVNKLCALLSITEREPFPNLHVTV